MSTTPPSLPLPRQRISGKRAAEILGCSESYYYALLKGNKISHWATPDGRNVTTEANVRDYLERQVTGAAYHPAVA